MSATVDKLVRMANQIATELGHQQGEGAVAATCAHITQYWDPRMRAQIIGYLDEGGAGLNVTSRAAVAMLADAARAG